MPRSALSLLWITCRAIILVILAALAISPAVLLAILVHRYSVNVPSWDEWSFSELFRLWHAHALTFDYLISQHNESRKFFPRLVILAIGIRTRWNVRYDMAFIIVLAAITSLNILLLAFKTLGGPPERKLFLWFLANILIFTLAGQENWLWGLQMVCYFPIACITTALVLFQFRMPLVLKTVLGIALALISTFSYANGMLAFFLLAPALLYAPGTEKSSRATVISCAIAWAVVLAGSYYLYFHNYVHPPSSPAMVSPLKNTGQLFVYFLAFLGSPLKSGTEQQNLTLAAWLAGAVLFLFLLTLLRLALHHRDRTLFRASLPWLMLAIYSLLSGAITTIGRFGFGMVSSLASRYCAFSVFLMIAVIFLIPLVEDASPRRKPVWRISKAVGYGLLTVAFLYVCTLTDIAGAQDMNTRWIVRIQGKAALQWSEIASDPVGLNILYPDPEVLHRYARLLDQWHYLNPPLIRNADIRPWAIVPDHRVGSFDVFVWDSRGNYFCGGWGWLEDRRAQPDCILITADPPEGFRPVIAVTCMHTDRTDVNQYLHAPNAGQLGWGCEITPTSVPRNATSLSAWAFDELRGVAYYLGTLPIPKAPDSRQ